MPQSIEMWKNFYYYPGTSTDLAKLLFERASNSVKQNPLRTITLYTLVTVNPSRSVNDGEVKGIEKVVLQLCSLSLVDRADNEKTEVRRSIQTELKQLLFPGRILHLDPRIWSVRSYDELVNIDEDFGMVQVALGTLTIGFIKPDFDRGSTYGIAVAAENEALSRFRAMTIRLEKEALSAVFLDEDQDEATKQSNSQPRCLYKPATLDMK